MALAGGQFIMGEIIIKVLIFGLMNDIFEVSEFLHDGIRSFHWIKGDLLD